jgi:Flp pilus assembly protein TadG
MRHRSRTFDRAGKPQRGVAAVEFALVLPLLLVILFGIIDFGLMLYDKAMITNAAREGARAGIVLRSPRLTKPEIEAVATDYCRTMLIRLAGSGECTATATLPASVTFAQPLQVTVNYQYDGPILSLIALLPGASALVGPLNLGSTAVMKYE